MTDWTAVLAVWVTFIVAYVAAMFGGHYWLGWNGTPLALFCFAVAIPAFVLAAFVIDRQSR